MKSLSTIVLALLITTSCNIEKSSKVNEATTFFKTDDSTKLFFKNVRRPYYDVDVMEEAQLEIYRFKKRIKESDQPLLNLSIVNNWMNDEAYILIEPNEAAGPMAELHLRWKDVNDNSGDIMIESQNKQSQVMFAAEVYEQIKKGSNLYLVRNNENVDILNDTKSREAFRISMFDYFRLTSID